MSSGFTGTRVSARPVASRSAETSPAVNAGAATLASAAAFAVGGSAGTLSIGGAGATLGNTSVGGLTVTGPMTIHVTGPIKQGLAVNVAGLSDLSGTSITLPLANQLTGGVVFNADNLTLGSAGNLAIAGTATGFVDLTLAGNLTQTAALNTPVLTLHANAPSIGVALADIGNVIGSASFMTGPAIDRANELPLQVANAGSYASITYSTASSTPVILGPVIVADTFAVTAQNAGIALPSVTASNLVAKAFGPLTLAAGASLNVGSADLASQSIGSALNPFDLGSAQTARFTASFGDAYLKSSAANLTFVSRSAASGDAVVTSTGALSLNGDLAAIGTVSMAGAGLSVVGNVLGTAVNLDSGKGDLLVTASNKPTTVSANFINLNGANISLAAGNGSQTTSAAGGGSSVTVGSVDVTAKTSATVNAVGNFVISGGSADGAHAGIKSDGPVKVTGSKVQLVGGKGKNAYAQIDPAAGRVVTIDASSVTLQGGAGDGAFAAIVADGDITVNSPVLTLSPGSGKDADAVLVSVLGSVKFPTACDGCVKLSANPLGDGLTQSGAYGGGSSEAATLLNSIFNASLLSTFEAKFDTIVDGTVKKDKDDKTTGKDNIVVEATCK